MTRLDEKKDSVEDLQSEIAKLKKGLKRKQSKKILSCSNCMVLFFLVILILIFLGYYVLAKSGLKDVAYLTDRFYTEPQPSHLVKSTNLTDQEKDILAILQVAAAQKFLQQPNADEFNIILKLTEEQLTELIRDKVAANDSLNEKIDYIQLAVLDDDLELFIKSKEPDKWILTLNIKPVVKDGKIDLKVQKFRIGNLRLPNIVGNITFSYFTAKSINSALAMFAEFGQVQQVDLFPGMMSVKILINNLTDLI